VKARHVGLTLLLLASSCAGAPPSPSTSSAATPEVGGPHGVTGHRSGHALFYVVPVAGGVVLVDSGFDDRGVDIAAAVAGRPILGVLITHAHVDHWSGLATVDAPVWAGAADVEAMQGRRRFRPLLQHIGEAFTPRPPRGALRAVADGDVVELAGERFVARHLPGHTAGSIVWRWRDVAFSGDAIVHRDVGVGVAGAIISDNEKAARASVSRLWGDDIAVLLDGHHGRIDDATAKLAAFVDAHEGLP
jgi:glyoxylase-like metal-dependent hydrolase (beta-lactamase superfamily II)